MLKIYIRQFGLGLMWSAVAVGIIRVISLGNGYRFDYRLAGAAVVGMCAMQMIWARKHQANVGEIVSAPRASDLSRSPVRELLITGAHREAIVAQLVSTIAAESAVEIGEYQPGVYEIRRKPARGRARARLTMASEGSGVRVRIAGRIPWWVGVDEGRTLCLVTEVGDRLTALMA